MKGPFEGIMGFSQGGIMTSILCGKKIQNQSPLPFNFIINIAGFKARALELQPLFEQKFKIPSLHIYGEKDTLKEGTIAYSKQFEDPIVVSHEFGHDIPQDEPTIERIVSFVNSQSSYSRF
eukprot:TRINITY_DN4422_c0_g1_i1.p1 TRINITY_DN4422_c0_g1~~TRINITY_DN4422_c0_g1_i1.p1  ORF type:complete len:121 (-),score=34.20 TRINITY_DN4422_c0_g1_i1:44-406(-)